MQEGEPHARDQLHMFLRAAGGQAQQPSNYDATRQALEAMLHHLGVVRTLAEQTAKDAEERPRGKTPDLGRLMLIRRLRHAYETLHPRCRYTIIYTKNAGNLRTTQPSGRALVWTRALFDLMGERSAELQALAKLPDLTPQQRALTSDTCPEFQELSAWAQRTDTLAEAIRREARSRSR